MNWPALLLLGVVATAGLAVAVTAYVVAGGLVREFLDAADPMAAFTDDLQDEVDAALAGPDFARWEREFSS